jgi:hypothetical protein
VIAHALMLLSFLRSRSVGNLPWDTTDQQLAAHCGQAGQVTYVRLAIDPATRRGKGYAFVEFRSMQEAGQAIRQLNNADFRGRALRVDYSDPNHRGKTQQQVEAMAAAARGELPPPPPSMIHGRPGPMGGMGMGGGVPFSGPNAVPLAAMREQEDLRKVFSQQQQQQQDVHMADRYAAGPAAAASSASQGPQIPITVGSQAPTVQPGAQPYGTDTIAKLVTSLTKPQLLEILSEMKKFSSANPEGAKQLLFDSPQVAQTLLHIMIMFGLVRPQDVAMIQTHTRPTAGDAPKVGLPQQQHAPVPAAQQPSFAPPPQASYAPQNVYAQPPSVAAMPLPPVPQPVAAPAAAALTEQDAFMLQTIRELAPEQIQQLPQEVQDKIRLLQQQLEAQQRR